MSSDTADADTDNTEPVATSEGTSAAPTSNGEWTAQPAPVFIGARIHTLNRPNMVSVGTIVWLASELMFFAGLFAIYFTHRAIAAGQWPPPPPELDLPYALVLTIILIASSFTCQFGVFAASPPRRRAR